MLEHQPVAFYQAADSKTKHNGNPVHYLVNSTIEDAVQKGKREYDAQEERIRNAAQRFVNCKRITEIKDFR